MRQAVALLVLAIAATSGGCQCVAGIDDKFDPGGAGGAPGVGGSRGSSRSNTSTRASTGTSASGGATSGGGAMGGGGDGGMGAGGAGRAAGGGGTGAVGGAAGGAAMGGSGAMGGSAAMGGGTATGGGEGGSGGVATPPCLTQCTGTCVDTLTDPAHCGACSVQCKPGVTCDEGVCGRVLFRGHGTATPSVVDASGDLYTWGNAAQLQSGTGLWTSFFTAPTRATKFAFPVRYAASAGASTCALLAIGAVACLGGNTLGEVGDGTTGGPDMCSDGVGCVGDPYPTIAGGIVELAGGSNWDGGNHVCARTASGRVLCWGQWDNVSGATTPTPIALPPIVELASATNASCALAIDGTVWCWGGLWVDPPSDHFAGAQIPGLTGVTTIGAGQFHACAKAQDGLYCWGNNRSAQLGSASNENPIPAPSRVVDTPGLTDAEVIQIEGGSDATCALTAVGDVYCWGLNAYGLLANGAFDGGACPNGASPCIPTPQKSLVTNAVEIAVAGTCAFARLADGRFVVWGGCANGTLGDGEISANHATPVDLSPFP